MKIVVMRHGDAVSGADNDASRALTELGLTQSRAMASWLAPQWSKFVKVLVSPYLRAQQTWQGIAPLLPAHQVEVCDDLVPGGDASRVIDYLLALESECDSLLLVSHLPLVGHLVAELCPGVMPPMFVTSAMVAIELNDGQGKVLWQQAPHLLGKVVKE